MLQSRVLQLRKKAHEYGASVVYLKKKKKKKKNFPPLDTVSLVRCACCCLSVFLFSLCFLCARGL